MSSPSQARPRPVYPSDLARSERRRAQKAAQRTDEQQLAHELASELETVARSPKFQDLPELITRINSLARSIRIRGNSAPDRDADAIMDALMKPFPARLDYEIATDTGLMKSDVKTTLAALIATGVVREMKTPRGIEYWPTGKSCGDVLP